MQRIRKAVIPAAGFGTRFLPATKATPKEMLPIVDKPTIQYIVEEALASGIEEILIISGHAKRAIEDHFDSNGDGKPVLRQLIDIYNETGASVLGCQTVPEDKVSSYGIVKGEPTDNKRMLRVLDMVEKPSIEDAPSRMAVLGRYVITPAIFDILAHTLPGKGNEIQLTDALKVLANRQPVYAYDFEGIRYDLGDKLGFLKATVEFALRRKDLGESFKAYLKQIVSELN